MDLNRKYAEHQRAVMQASRAPKSEDRAEHLQLASTIAKQIAFHQRKLGAAASCAWSSSRIGSAHRTSTPAAETMA